MNRQAIYMCNGLGLDEAIRRGLTTAGCEVLTTHDVAETLQYLIEMKGSREKAQDGRYVASPAVLVAEVQAGAISLLKMIRECGVDIPPTVLFDREGSIPAAIMALQLGVRGYMLATDPEIDREVNTYVIAGSTESFPSRARAHQNSRLHADLAISSQPVSSRRTKKFEWIAIERMIRNDTDYLRLSPVEAIIFDMLYSNRGQVVSKEELIRHALEDGIEFDPGIRLLRPHMMRLHKKLDDCAWLSARVINVRGLGYMLI